MRTAHEIADNLWSAFIPLHCETEVHYDREVGFRVYDRKGLGIYTQHLVVITPLLDDTELTRFVSRARIEVETRSGIKLDTWKLTTYSR
jgi:hypothetical protein